MFAEICTLARPDFPQPAVEQFLSLHQTVSQAVTIANALALTRGGNSSSSEEVVPDQSAQSVVADKFHASSNWVATALASDLAMFSLLQVKQDRQVAARTNSLKQMAGPQHQLAILLQEGQLVPGLKAATVANNNNMPVTLSSTLFARTSTASRPALSSVSITENGKKQETLGRDAKLQSLATSKITAVSPVVKRTLTKSTSQKNGQVSKAAVVAPKELCVPEELSWFQGARLIGISELGKHLHMESQKWFLQFMESALDSGFRIPNGSESSRSSSIAACKVVSQQDNSQIASMLSQLKHVNDWLDQVKEEGLDPQMSETKVRLKRKIYEFLLEHVESAASALGNVSSVIIAAKTPSSHMGRRDS